MYYNPKKELIKNVLTITFILSIAVVSTYYIYNKFDHSEIVDYSSESLDITFKEEQGDEINITTVSPVTDSVGLSSKAHTITIKNNLTEKTSFIIKLSDNLKKQNKDNCNEYQIPREDIKISVRYSSGDTEIYNLSDIDDEILVIGKLKPLETEKYTIRAWISSESSLPMGSSLHYHGLIEIEERSE